MLPETQLHPGFSEASAHAVPWDEARKMIEKAEIFWLSTVRPDGRPHVTPLIAVWIDDALYFCTGEDERKRRNLAENPSCVLTTGCNSINEGLDIVIEGKAVRVISETQLQTIATALEGKYGPAWHVDVQVDAFSGDGGNVAWVYRVAPIKAFGFAKGQPFSQTRWRF